MNANWSLLDGAVHNSASQCSFSFCSQETPCTSMLSVNSPFSAQTQTNQVTGFASTQSNATSHFPLVHSNMFSAQTQHSGVTPFSPFSSRSNANSPAFKKQKNANSPFPSVHSNPFISPQTQSTAATKLSPFAPFSGHSNTNSPFQYVFSSNAFSGQTQSSGVTGFAPFSSQSNTNSPFPSVSSNAFSGQTNSSGLTGFAPFCSQSNANSYLSNYSNPFTSQSRSFNSTLSTTIPISGSRVAPYASAKEPEGNFHSISSMPVYTSKSHEELRFEDYSLCNKGAQATPFTSMPSVNSPFSAQTQTNQVTGFASTQSNATSHFPLVHSNMFSAQTQHSGVTPFSPFSSRSNANSPAFKKQKNANSPFPSVHSNPFISPQTQSTAATKLSPFAPFSGHSNTNSPFQYVFSSNAFSGQTQSSGVTGFAPFSSQSNTNSPFPSVSSNAFSGQTNSSGLTGFAPFCSQSNANSYLSNYSNPFTSQSRSFNSTLSTTIPISGSRVAPYASAKEPEGNFHSISSMPVYTSKSHEELRFEDYSLCNKAPLPVSAWSPLGGAQATPFTSMPSVNSPFSAQTPYASTKEPEGNFHSISSMPVYTSKSHEELRFEDYSLSIKDGQCATTQTGNGFQLNNSFYPSLFPSVKPTQTGFISPENTQSIPSNSPGLFTPSTSATTQENTFASSSAFDFPKSPNIAPPLPSFVSNSSVSQVSTTESTLCSNCNHAKTQSLQPGLVGPSTNLSPNQLKPSSIQQTVQELGKDDAVPVSSSHPGSVISVQYGISSLSVSDKAAPTRRRSLLIVRHPSLNRTKMLCPRYSLDSNASRVPFFMAGEEKATEGVAKTNSAIFPRENPRSWIHPPTKESPQSHNPNTLPEMEHTSINVYGNGNVTLQVHRAKEKQTDTSEGVINYKHDTIDVDGIMPKLKNDDYYTEPSIQELAAREKEEPGFCHRVKDFVVGRRGFGSIKFTGETDVEGLELDSLVQFNYHEVVVYMDDSKKPEVREGLNKPAEVTLLNVKCINKKTGEEYKDGHLVDKYKNLLIRKSAEQGAEFVSYDPVKGEWKFKVMHF
ncbi:nuclear pore complex protein NUP98A-like isoform X3 [Ipomoea triloba]|uniref:nuclear pore complex protein NUP98A-like isoform X3 n=1 Tax=Ipomoea triloba TaxID=35885 RepID=UPI00125D1374|nr:nuclear pore complex protein NUP98A-like isoform X3 [Ipomoea triloba]